MTCYQKQLRSLFEVLELEYDKPNRVRVDAAIRQIVGLSGDAHCPEVWSALKALPPQEREALPASVAELL